MATQAELIKRLRRLIDDVGHGYAQSAPGYSTDISATVTPTINVIIDDAVAGVDVALTPPLGLTTGKAIAAAIMRAVRAADPALPSGTTEGFSNFVCTYDLKDGYVLRSGSIGSKSAVTVLPPTAGDDAAAPLKLGAANGGYETIAQLNFSDEELSDLIAAALSRQNAATLTQYDIASLGGVAETAVVYRAWSSIVDINLGRSAGFFWHKVQAEEAHEDQIFANYLKLADWLRKTIDDLDADLIGSNVQVSTVSRWDSSAAQFVPLEVYNSPEMGVKLLSAVLGPNAGEVLIEFAPIRVSDLVDIYVGHSTASPVISREVFTDPDYETTFSKNKGFESPAVLDRTLKTGKNTLVKITGLSAATTYYFALQATDLSGNRYFSNELTITLP